MKPKRKLNPFSDMHALGKRLTEEAQKLLERERIFRTSAAGWGFDEKTFKEVDFPSPTHDYQMPVVFTGPRSFLSGGSRSGAGKNLPNKFLRREINLLPKAYSATNKHKQNFFRFHFTAKTLPVLARFVTVCLLFLSVIPFLRFVEQQRSSVGMVLGAAATAYGDLLSAESALRSSDFQSADASLSQAYEGFGEALDNFRNLGVLASSLGNAAGGRDLLVSARESTLGLQYLNEGIKNFSDFRLGASGFVSVSKTPDDALRAALENFENASRYLTDAESHLQAVDTSAVPPSFRVPVEKAKSLLAEIRPGLEQFVSLQAFFFSLVSTEEKTFLLLFENNRESRATGGFIGTYGILKIGRGQINELKIESIYNPDGQLKRAIAAPGPLQISLSKTWAMRDSNWFFNFPDSAVKAKEFLEMETNTTADRVIAFTPEIFVRLMQLVGPIDMPEYGATLTSQNFVDVVQYQTSVVYDRQLNQPKKFLADFAPRLLDKISKLDTAGWLSFLQVFLQGLQQKQLMLYSENPSEQQKFESANWAGAVRDSAGDYLAVVNSNVGAGKTDQEIKQEVDLSVHFTDSGKQINKLTIVRSRGQTQEKDFPVNVDYLRIFVPAGSKLLSAQGFDDRPFYPSEYLKAETDPDLSKVDQSSIYYPSWKATSMIESGKTVFAGFITLPPDSTRNVSIEYELSDAYGILENPINFYSLLAQKQPGAANASLSVTLSLPKNTEVLWKYPENLAYDNGQISVKTQLATDEFWGLIYKMSQ